MTMKKNIILAFLLLCFCSCSKERNGGEIPMLTRGYINLEITEEHTANDSPSDDIKTLRFIVITDLGSFPKTEVNEYKEVVESNRASALNAVLEVSQTESGINNKLIVVIANEPGGMKNDLDNVSTLQELDNIHLEMGSFVSVDHLSLQSDAVMPMSGVVWTSKNNIYSTIAEAENNRVSLSLERAVARVDVYLNTDLADGMQIIDGSTVTLGNTYAQSYFIRHEIGTHVMGKIQTVENSALTSKVWTQTVTLLDVPYKTGIPSSVYVCTFYTPERNCATDKLRLDVGVKVGGDEGFKSGGIFLTTANDENDIAHPINIVRRNTVYKVTVTIGANGITGLVQDWNSEDINTEL